jgi:hypothetical protein
LARYAAPKLLVRNFTVALTARVKEYVTIFHLDEVAFSINYVDRHIERLVESFVISAATSISHVQIPISRRKSRRRVSAEYNTPT